MTHTIFEDDRCPECGGELTWEDVSGGRGKAYAQVCYDCQHHDESVSWEERHADAMESAYYA